MKHTSILQKRKNLMTGALLLCLTFFLSSSTNRYLDAGSTWQLIESSGGINAYVMETTCGSDDWLVFKFENTNSQSVDIDYTIIAKLDPTFPELTHSATLGGNQDVTGTCADDYELAIPDNFKTGNSLGNRLELTFVIK